MHLDSRDLELVRGIAENGSISSAARVLHVTQSAVSQRLAKLQEKIGTAMFTRRDGIMVPTQAGQRLADAAVAVTHELDTAARFLQQLADCRHTRLRLTTQCYTLYRWLPFVIRDLHKKFPDLNADVVPEATDKPYDFLQRDEVDIALVSKPESGYGFDEKHLFNDELFAVMSDDHALARRKYLAPPDFLDQTLVLYSGTRHAIVEEVLNPAGVVPGRIVQVRITEAIVELVRAGQGVAILAGWAFNDIDNNGLTVARITRSGMRRTWRAVIGDQCRQDYAAAMVQSVKNIGRSLGRPDWRKSLQ